MGQSKNGSYDSMIDLKGTNGKNKNGEQNKNKMKVKTHVRKKGIKRERGEKGEIKKVEREIRGRIYLRRKVPRSDSKQLVTEMGIRFVIKYCSRLS